ncbi:hypothetical protein [Nocardia otitidiscaviarum]|uniref:hypothetical protein n=1 Tax=Nocardia otitidiscaviarum TaxID=1823 RepID=UPI002453EC86|nr:hypothetical protein [Nocardia otitidiscaviarum]
MTENASQATRYAIRLPNGKLCDYIPCREPMYGTLETLPDGTNAYLWTAQDDAYAQINTIAFDLRDYGLRDVFPALAKVVEVRISCELTDLAGDSIADEPIVETEVAGATEPRTWDSVAEIPVGTRFHGALSVGAYERRENDCLHLDSGFMYRLNSFGAALSGFVEVLPEEPQPRTWQSAADIPEGVQFQAVPCEGYVWIRKGANAFPIDNDNWWASTRDLDNDHPQGFVEVLS